MDLLLFSLILFICLTNASIDSHFSSFYFFCWLSYFFAEWFMNIWLVPGRNKLNLSLYCLEFTNDTYFSKGGRIFNCTWRAKWRAFSCSNGFSMNKFSGKFNWLLIFNISGYWALRIFIDFYTIVFED